jgi:hypothetical protein
MRIGVSLAIGELTGQFLSRCDLPWFFCISRDPGAALPAPLNVSQVVAFPIFNSQ